MKILRFLIISLLILLPGSAAFATVGQNVTIDDIEIVSGAYATGGFYECYTGNAGINFAYSDSLSSITASTTNYSGTKRSSSVQLSRGGSYNFNNVTSYPGERISSRFYKTGINGYHYISIRYYPDGM